MPRHLSHVVLTCLLLAASFAPLAARELGIDERVAAQRAVEEVLWAHRTWPEQNPTPKPALDEVLPETAIRARVEDYLRKSNGLAHHWNEALTAERLQAEIDRMVRDTRQPEMLEELFAALGNDPFLIAECLARPLLADRLIRNWYARDTRFHAATRRRVERAVGSGTTLEKMKTLGGTYAERSFGLDERPAGATSLDRDDRDVAILANGAEWNRLLRELGQRIGRLPGAARDPRGAGPAEAELLPLGVPGPIHEDDEGFTITALVGRRSDRVDLAVVSWPKVSFDAWWAGQRSIESTRLDPPAAAYQVPEAAQAQTCSADSWVPIGNAVPDPITGARAVWTGTEMIVWGGFGFVSTSAGFRYNPATDSWKQTGNGPNLPAGRGSHTAVWTGTEMIVWGGLDPDGKQLDDGGRYDPLADAWSPVGKGPGLPSARYRHTAVWTGTAMIVWGGRTRNPTSFFNTGGAYDPLTDTWSATDTTKDENGDGVPDVPVARAYHTAVWTGTEMIVWGGIGGGPYGGRYDPSTDTWTPTSTVGAPSVRYLHSAVWTGTKMVVWGGETDFSFGSDTGGIYDPAGDTWVPTGTSNAPTGRTEHSALWTGQRMIVWGGTDALGRTLNTGGVFDPFSNSWELLDPMTANTPGPRTQHVAVWTGTAMIVWGGYTGDGTPDFCYLTGDACTQDADCPVDTCELGPGTCSVSGNSCTSNPQCPPGEVCQGFCSLGGLVCTQDADCASVCADFDGVYLSSGGRFNPSTGAWTPTGGGASMPSPRRLHTAVATGSEMIVWGGESWVNGLDSGGRYRPATDTWTPTSQGANVPEPRARHTAIWNGRHMIVWGGVPRLVTDPHLNTGGRYNPATDQWLPMNPLGPTGRIAHTAVWTGSVMIVWGGHDGSQDLATGGRYNSGFDVWSPTGTDPSLPDARSYHTAVWSGSEMIVWGGGLLDPDNDFSTTTGFNSGGRYNPWTNRWKATGTAAGTPSARFGHTAVWSGSEMIVWGGNDGVLTLATGGRYRPSTDAWTPTGVGPGVPGPRRFHTAVWLGGEMLVWGGRSDTRLLNTGASYLPGADTWAPLNGIDPDLPSARVWHTAVALDSDMLVWGGAPMTATGGRYCPALICPATTALEAEPSGQGILDALRELRDGVLEQSAEGRALTREFYAHATEISLLLTSNPDLLTRARDLLLANLPSIEALTGGVEVTIDSASVQAIDRLLADVESRASQELQRSVGRHRVDLRSGRLPGLPGLRFQSPPWPAEPRRME